MARTRPHHRYRFDRDLLANCRDRPQPAVRAIGGSWKGPRSPSDRHSAARLPGRWGFAHLSLRELTPLTGRRPNPYATPEPQESQLVGRWRWPQPVAVFL